MKKKKLKSYNIHIGDAAEALTKYDLKRYSQIFVLVDEHTKQFCLPLIEDIVPAFKMIEIASGEKNKNLSSCQQIWDYLIEEAADRSSLLINLGGGVIGDMGGFCASTYKRGIYFIQIPTTLLSQVDASVGSKLGVDYQGVKNIVGVFNDPVTVIIDPVFLSTLPRRELRSGYAEILKHGLIQHKDLWKHSRNFDLENLDWTSIIDQSVDVKIEVVSKDPFENGLRKILNFGHTIGHAIESLCLESKKPLLHGEAIAIGMIAEAWLSTKYAGLKEISLEEITKYLIAIYGREDISDLSRESLIGIMKNDKKNENESISLSLLKKIGDCGYNFNATEDDIYASILYYQKL